jgi:hypothetical protein
VWVFVETVVDVAAVQALDQALAFSQPQQAPASLEQALSAVPALVKAGFASGLTSALEC